MRSLYVALVARLLRVLCTYCLRRGRYVDYVHQKRLYLRRYAVAGWLTGDKPPTVIGWQALYWAVRAHLPNLYVHQIINPDLDTCLHDHPWPWGVSWIALGGYTEHRGTPTSYLQYPWYPFRRTLTAPALNVLRGSTFHRIAETHQEPLTQQSGSGTKEDPACPAGPYGAWTIFLAGPRAHAKRWGYLVPGRGYVSHSERHLEFGGEEKRGAPVNV